MPKLFDQAVIDAMARINARPIIFPYSNPTSRSECTAEEAYKLVAGPRDFRQRQSLPARSVWRQDVRARSGQQRLHFPAIGMAIYATQARRVTDELFLCAATSVAEQVTQANLDMGLIYPPQSDILNTSVHVATKVAELIFEPTSPERPDHPTSATSSSRSCISRTIAALSDFRLDRSGRSHGLVSTETD